MTESAPGPQLHVTPIQGETPVSEDIQNHQTEEMLNSEKATGVNSTQDTPTSQVIQKDDKKNSSLQPDNPGKEDPPVSQVNAAGDGGVEQVSQIVLREEERVPVDQVAQEDANDSKPSSLPQVTSGRQGDVALPETSSNGEEGSPLPQVTPSDESDSPDQHILSKSTGEAPMPQTMLKDEDSAPVPQVIGEAQDDINVPKVPPEEGKDDQNPNPPKEEETLDYEPSPLLNAMSKAEVAKASRLQRRLNLILTQAQKETEKEVIPELWGVLLDPTSTDPRIPVILSKFLRANTDNFEAAEVSLRQTLVWRAEFSLPTLLASEVFPETLGDNVGFIYRKDTKGRPVIYNRYGGLDTKVIFGDLDRFVRWRVRLMEQSMLQCDFLHVDSLLVVHDYAGVGVLSYDKYAKAASKKTIAVLQEYYPECLAVKLFIHIPWWGASIYKLVSRWIPEATKKKMSIVSTTETHSALCQYINEEDLPTVYQKPSAQMKGKGSKALQGNSVSTDAPMALEGDGGVSSAPMEARNGGSLAPGQAAPLVPAKSEGGQVTKESEAPLPPVKDEVTTDPEGKNVPVLPPRVHVEAIGPHQDTQESVPSKEEEGKEGEKNKEEKEGLVSTGKEAPSVNIEETKGTEGKDNQVKLDEVKEGQGEKVDEAKKEEAKVEEVKIN